MDASLDTEQDNIAGGDHNSEQQGEHQIGTSEDADTNAHLNLSKKSWGFRRTTIARREFMDEIIDLDPSPPPIRRGRSRRTRQTPRPAEDPQPTPKPCRSASSVIDDLEWSAPSSPVDAATSEATTGGVLDPSLWQDFGSAFHTAFSLLGGNEDTPMDVTDPLPGPDDPHPTDASEAGAEVCETGADGSDSVEAAEDPSGPALMDVAGDENQEVLLISSQEDDSDNLTLMQLKEHLTSKGPARKGGRAKARGKGRGRGRGRGRGKGRGRGRGRAVELESSTAEDDEEEDRTLVNQEARPQLHEPQKPEGSPEADVTLANPTKLIDSDCIVLDSDLDQPADVTQGQYENAVEEGRAEEERGYSSISDSEGYDPNALYCICRQKHNKRFMICCDGCHEWFHGDCVGIGEAQGRCMDRGGEEYTCPTCTSKKQRLPLPDNVQSEDLLESPEIPASLPDVLAPTASAETTIEVTKPQESKGDAEVMAEQSKPEPDIKTERESSLPLCIGPGCPKQALQDSVYCGTDCILQHAAVTMKSLTGPKEPKPRSRPQRKAAAKGQRLGRVTQSAAERLKESEEEQEGDGAQKEAASPLACDPSFRAVEAAPVPSSKLCMASANKDSEELEAKEESVPPVPQKPTTATSSSIPVADTPLPQGSTQGKTQKPLTTGGISKKQRLDSPQHTPTNLHKPSATPAPATPGPSSSRLPVMPAPKLAMGSFVIPKKQPAPPPAPSQGQDPVAGAQPSASPAATNETRTLPVAPAPIAPSSRPSQPNNQVRQSIQRSLASILFKRVTDCEELDMSESDVGKLVTSIEMEMFDIFRNTDSKYMNKYRTIMFNLKDPKNKGLLFRVIGGEISPFRLARMSQKDMQATKVPEPSAKETAEVVKDTVVKAPPCSLQKPDAVKVDLPSLSTPKTDKPMEQKRSVAPVVKSRLTQPSQIGSVPDILSCMLKDTTSEHKTHLFDLKCKICTGQMPEEEEEPAHKRSKVSDSRDKREYGRPSYGKPPENPWRSCAGDDSPLQAPPDSPDTDSPLNPLLEPSSRLVIDSPELAIVESPASLVLESPASPPVLESPASPVRDSPASPTADGFKTRPPARAYAPVVIPAVSTVTITRRDPRTAANRSPSLSAGAPGPGCTTKNQAAPYAALKVASSGPTMPPAVPLPPPLMPKSILMKPSPSADPRLYQTSSRNMNSHSTADGETTQFLANQTILWKGFLNMLSVAKFMTKGYVVSGSGEILKAELPDTIQIGGRILPQTVWDYVERVKTSVTKELCVVRFHPATEEEEVAYVSLFSYFSSRRRFGVVANSSRNVKDMYLVPISAREAVPSILQPIEGAGLEKNRPNLLLGLAIVQKPKRPGCLQQESEEKRPKVQMSKDPMWIPKPPVLYGSDKPDIFQPYDPETPITGSPPSSPAASGTLSIPSLPIPSKSTISQFLPSNRGTLPVSTSAPGSSNQSILTANSDENPTATSANKTPLQTILKSLFGNKTSDTVAPAESSSVVPTVGATKPLYTSQTTRPMVDPIVQQYGQKSKIKAMEEEDHDFDRPYDPEEEYDPAMGYGVAQTIMKVPTDPPTPSTFAEDDVAYDPEDESMFEDVKKHNTIAKGHVPTATPCPTSASTEAPTPVSTTDTACASTTPVLQNLPTGIVVVSAATLTEQQRMLEELNKQIEEQKRQLKEQEEALRQQREAVGMFMAHFSVSDTLMSPPQKIVPATPLPSQQSGIAQSGQKTSESTEGKESLTKSINNQTLEIVKKEETSSIPESTNTSSAIIEQDETVKDTEQYFSAGEIEDSDVAYDPEDESLFNEMQDDIFQGEGTKPHNALLSRSGHGSPRKGSPSSSHRGRRQRQSPKRRSRRERDHRGSPSRSAQQRSPSHSRRRKDRERHRRSERDRSRHGARDQSERQGRHRRERASRRHSRGQRESPSSRKRDSASFSPKRQMGTSPQVLQESQKSSAQSDPPLVPVSEPHEGIKPSHTPVAIKMYHDEPPFKCNKAAFTASNSQTNSQTPNSSVNCSPFLNVKLEKEECPLSLKPLKYATWHQQGITTTTRQLQNEFAFNSKIESPIPLRELEPPTRDSPQSPDPEPQFVQQSSIEKGDANLVIKKEEEVVDVSGQIGTGIQIERKGIGSKHCDILSKGFTGTNMGLEIKNAQPDVKVPPMHNIASLRGDMSKVEITNFGNNFGNRAPAPIDQGTLGVKQNIMGPETNASGSMISGLWQLMGGPDMKGIGSDSWKTGPNMSDAKMRVQGENPDIISSGNVMKDPSIRDLDPNVQGPGSPSVNPVRGVPARAVTHPHTRGLDPLKVPDVGGRDLGTDIRGRGQGWSRFGDYSPNRSLAPHMTHSSPSVKDERPDFKSLHSVKRFIEERRRPDPVSDSMSQSQSRDGAESNVGPGVNNDRQGPQRALGPAIERPGLSFRDESSGNNMCGARQDNQGLRSNPSGLQLNVKQEMGGPYIGSDGSNPATQRPVGGPCPDMQNENRNQEVMRGPGPNTSGPGWEGGWGVHNPIGLDVRDAWKGSERRGSDLAFSGLNVQDEWRNNGPNKIEHMEIPRPDRRGTDMENQGSARDPAFRGPGPDQDQGTRPDLSGFGGQHFKGARSDYKGQLPEKTTSEMEGLGPDMSRSGSLDIREPGSNRRGPGVCPGPDEKGLGGPHFMGPENDRWPDFRGTRTDRGGTDMEGPGQDRRGMGRPHFRGSGPDRRASDMEGLGPERRGPGGTDFREVGADGREPYVEGPGPDRRRGGGPDFRGIRSARRGAHMDSPGPDRKGPGGSHFRGPGPDRREADVEGLGTAMRDRDNEPGRGGKGSDMEGPGLDRRGRGGPHFRGSGPDRRGQDLEGHGPDRTGPDREGPGPDRRGPRGPDFRRSRPYRNRPDLEGPGLGWRGVESRRGRDKEGLSVDKSGPKVGGPDLTGMPLDGQGIVIENPGPDVTRIEGPKFSRPEPDRRGRPGPDFRGHGLEKSVPRIECEPVMRGPGNIDCREQELEPDRKRPRRPDGRNLGHEMRGPDMECTEPEMEDYGPRMRASPGPNFRGPGPDRRGPGDPDSEGTDFRGPGPDTRLIADPDFMESGSDGPDFRGLWLDRRGSDGPDYRESGPDWRGLGGPDFRGTRSDGRGPVGPDFSEARGPGGPDLIRPGPNRRGAGGPDFMGPGPEERGPGGPDFRRPGPDRKGPGGPDFREQGPDRRGPDFPDSMGPDPDRRGSGGPDFMGPGPDGRGPGGPDFRRPAPERRGPGGPNFREPGPDRRGPGGPDFRGPGPDRRGPRGPDFRGPGPDRRGPDGPDFGGPGPDGRGPGGPDGPDFRGPGPDRRGPGGPEFRGPGPEMRGPGGPDYGGPGPDGRGPGGPDFRGPSPDGRGPGGPDFRGPGPDRRVSGGPDFRGPSPDGRGTVGPEFRGPRPDRRVPGGPDFRGPSPDGRGPGGPDCRGPGPDRRGPGGPDFRGPSPDGRGPGGPDCRGPGADRRGPGGPDFRGPGPDRRGPAGSDFGGPGPDRRGPGGSDFRGPSLDRRGPGGPDLRGPSPDRRGPGGSDFGGPGPNRRGPGGPDFGGPGHNGRGPGRPDFRGPGPDRRGPGGPDFRGPGPDRRGPGGPDFRGPGPDRRGPGGPDFRGPGPDMRDPCGSDFRGPGPDRRGPGGTEFRGSGPDRRGPGGSDFIEPGQERRGGGPGSGSGLEVSHFEDSRSSGNEDLSGTWPNQESCSGPGPYRGGQNMEGPYRGEVDRSGHVGGAPNIRGRGPNIEDWQQDLRESRPEGSDNEYHGPRGTGSGPGFRGEFRSPNLEDPWPNRRGPERNQGISGRCFDMTVHDRKGPDLRNQTMESLRPDKGPVSERESEGLVTRPETKGPPSQGNRGLDPRGPESDFNKDIQGAGMRGSPGLKLRDTGLNPQPAVPEMKSLGSPVTKTLSTTADIGGLPHLNFESPHNQSANRLLKHKTPLLPTPTGLIRHPNRLIHKPNAFVHGRDWNRTPVGISRGTGEEIKKEDNQNDQLKGPFLCETDSDKVSKKTGEEPVEKKATE